jgi:hypothetical protein
MLAARFFSDNSGILRCYRRILPLLCITAVTPRKPLKKRRIIARKIQHNSGRKNIPTKRR